MPHGSPFHCVLLLMLMAVGTSSAGQLDLSFSVENPEGFTAGQLQILEDAIPEAEALWKRVITGYAPGISNIEIPIRVTGISSGFAFGGPSSVTHQGGYRLSTSGFISINLDVIDEYSNYENSGVNFVDEIMSHEVGHVLGIGMHWIANGVYINGSGRYTGPFGLAAYRKEFDADANFVPVELAGSSSTANKHWDQIMRSSVQEGKPSDPFSLSPLVGITDRQGRDLALELMTGAVDPDFIEPYLSNTTVQSLRDLGFTVVSIPEPSAWLLLLLGICGVVLHGRANVIRTRQKSTESAAGSFGR